MASQPKKTKQESNLIKSRQRVRDLAEVFTNRREVDAMLDLVGETAYDPAARFLEPACGNGNFLEAIIERKLSTVAKEHTTQGTFEFWVIRALTTTHGVDISPDNVEEARERLHMQILSFYSDERNTWTPKPGFHDSVSYVLETNIVCGDTLNGADDIVFVEYIPHGTAKYSGKAWRFSDLLEDAQNEASDQLGLFGIEPIYTFDPVHYLQLGLLEDVE